MDSFGGFLRIKRESVGLPLRKVAAELDVDTSILSKIERNEKNATIEMLPVFARVLNIPIDQMEIEFVKHFIISYLGGLEFLEVSLEETLKVIKK